MQENAKFERIGHRFLEYTKLRYFTALFRGKQQSGKLTKAYDARVELQLLVGVIVLVCINSLRRLIRPRINCIALNIHAKTDTLSLANLLLSAPIY